MNNSGAGRVGKGRGRGRGRGRGDTGRSGGHTSRRPGHQHHSSSQQFDHQPPGSARNTLASSHSLSSSTSSSSSHLSPPHSETQLPVQPVPTTVKSPPAHTAAETPPRELVQTYTVNPPPVQGVAKPPPVQADAKSPPVQASPPAQASAKPPPVQASPPVPAAAKPRPVQASPSVPPAAKPPSVQASPVPPAAKPPTQTATQTPGQPSTKSRLVANWYSSGNGKSKGYFNVHGLKQPPNRPGLGTEGRKMVVRANFFPLRLPRELTVYQYDVAMSPEKIPKSHCRKIFEEFLRIHLGGAVGAFDGSKSCYFARRPFQGRSMERPVQLSLDKDDKPKDFVVKLQEAPTFDIDIQHIQEVISNASESMPMIQALDVVLRHLPSLRMEPIGRSFFTKPDKPFFLGSGKEVWTGYYQSVRPTMGWKVMLNVDTAASAFYTEQSVFDFMCMTLRKCHPNDAAKPLSDRDKREFMRRELTDSERRRFSHEIKGLRIVVSHLTYPRKYKVVGLTQFSARKQTFPLSDESMCTVEDYFKEKYPETSQISHPHLPCLHVGQKQRHIYLPIDVCSIVGGQRCMKKLTDIQTSNMIRHTASPAWQREKAINDTVHNAGFETDPVAREFGISVSNTMVEIPSRVLRPPTLNYNRGGKVTPGEGKGCWDMKSGTKFYEGIRVSDWAVLVCADHCTCDHFVSELERISNSMGMEMARPLETKYLGRQSVENAFRQLLERHKKLDLILAIIDKRESYYDEVKRLGDTKGGMCVATQCVLSTTVEKRCNHSTIANICLKINARLGGVNSIVEVSSGILRQCPVIIFGADVTHPRSGDTTSPSIASVVASIDLQASRYRALHRNQKNRQEIIADLKDMAKEHFIEFRRFTKCKPEKIIFYRDGVSEGQFEAVRHDEIAALQRACLDLQPDGSYQPKITFIIVQKRHHTRFFPKSERDGVGKGRNVPPGTTVDSVITHNTEHDFYLCSHIAIQGTSRPCHYHVIWDDSDFSADALQSLSYQLCHMFWRCNRSVSYPAPTYYAHRDAAHARMLLRAQEEISSSGGSSHCGSDQQMTKEDMNNAIEIHKDRKNKMYFM